MQTSENIADLATAMTKVQAVIEGARKDSLNPHFKNKYADLSAVWEACRKPLADNGLAVIQSPGVTADGKMEMSTRLIHSSGQWIEGTMSIPIAKLDPQGYGSATTYARRYALAAMVGVSPEDDDGNAASKAGGRPQAVSAPITPAQVAELETLIGEAQLDTLTYCKQVGLDRLDDITADAFPSAKAQLERRISNLQKKAA